MDTTTVNTLARRALRIGDGALIVETTHGPAAALTAARMVLGDTARYVGMNRLGWAVYRAQDGS